MNHAPLDADHISRRWLGKKASELSIGAGSAIRRVAERRAVSQDINETFDGGQTFGERLADRVAAFGGSWTFLIAFGLFLMVWTGANLLLGRDGFDPYPFIFLNLMLSMVAAAQAPIIMMSQNRQAQKDRLDAGNDYQVNLKAEIEIMAL
ncbi:hypothetical protein LTR94_024977, partial [Friedmanniomyces endolithicus]